MSGARAIVLGASAGGPDALNTWLRALPTPLAVPVVIVQHIHRDSPGTWPDLLRDRLGVQIKNAEDKEPLEAGTIYMAPPGYHLLVERDRSLSLCVDELVSYSRPSIDVLFRSAAEAYREGLLAIVFTGANADGAAGAAAVAARGGRVLVQDPSTAHSSRMPEAALGAVPEASPMTLAALAQAAAEFAARGSS